MTDRDEMWVDLTQFDTQAADGVWDGTHRDPDAPVWYRDFRSLIHRAKGPAETHELADEPEMVATMHRATIGETLARLPRSSGARTLGRVLAMKAAAATTAGMISVAAAAAATTGIVATVAATVVVPVVKDHVVPMLNDHLTPTVTAPAEVEADDNVGSTATHNVTAAEPEVAPVAPADPATGPAGTVDTTAPLLAPDLAVTPAPATVDPVTTTEPPPVDAPVADPAATHPATTTVDPASTDPTTTTVDRPADRDPGPPAAADPEPANPGHGAQPTGRVASPPADHGAGGHG
jgi:hypothetical protein